MTRTETTFQNQAALIRNLEVQISQMASLLSGRQKGTLPSNTEPNPKEQVQAITLRSRKQLEQSQEAFMAKEDFPAITTPLIQGNSEARKEDEQLSMISDKKEATKESNK